MAQMSHFTPTPIEFRLLAAPTPLICVSHPGFSLTLTATQKTTELINPRALKHSSNQAINSCRKSALPSRVTLGCSVNLPRGDGELIFPHHAELSIEKALNASCFQRLFAQISLLSAQFTHTHQLFSSHPQVRQGE